MMLAAEPGEAAAEGAAPPPSARRRRWPWVVGLLLVLWVGLVGVLLFDAARHLQAGRDLATSARDDFSAASLSNAEPVDALEAAADHFRRARDRVRSPLLVPARVLPVVGRHLRSVQALSEAATELAGTTANAVDDAAGALRAPGSGGPARLAMLARLGAAVQDAQLRLTDLELGPSSALIGPLRDARVELADELDEATDLLERARSGIDAAEQLLSGPRRYLLVAANNAEMRAGSGMWLSGGEMLVAGGQLTPGDLGPLTDVAPVEPDGLTIDDPDLAARWGWLRPNDDWRNLMPSPRLDASATLAGRMWEAAGHGRVDGVLVVDAVAVASMLRATGPVEVDGHTYDADNVIAELLHGQYLTYDQANAERREALNALAQAVFQRIDDGAWRPAELIDALATAVSGRHLLAWSSDPVEQRGWEAAGMAGDVHPDSLLLSVLNRGGNKLDWFLDVAADIRRRRRRGGNELTITIRLHNRTPRGLPAYIAGPHPDLDLAAGTYRGYLTVNVPAAAGQIELQGIDLGVAGPDGVGQVVGGAFVLAAGDSLEATVRFRLPRSTGIITLEPTARFPAVAFQLDGAPVSDGERHTIFVDPDHRP